MYTFRFNSTRRSIAVVIIQTHTNGRQGGAHCAEYDIVLSIHDALESCQELEHDTTDGLGQSFSTLHPGHTTEGRCTPGEYQDYKLVVSADNADSK